MIIADVIIITVTVILCTRRMYWLNVSKLLLCVILHTCWYITLSCLHVIIYNVYFLLFIFQTFVQITVRLLCYRWLLTIHVFLFCFLSTVSYICIINFLTTIIIITTNIMALPCPISSRRNRRRVSYNSRNWHTTLMPACNSFVCEKKCAVHVLTSSYTHFKSNIIVLCFVSVHRNA